MSWRIVISLVWLSSTGLLLAGCQSAEDQTPQEPAAGVAAGGSLDDAAAPDEGPMPTAATDKAAPARPRTADRFTPPFPDRTDPFEPPKRAEGMVRRGDQPGETVELKGFVNVDEPRVVLAIDGVIAPLPEGGEKYGVHVIAIHPPSVVLQRGRSRWTATLE